MSQNSRLWLIHEVLPDTARKIKRGICLVPSLRLGMPTRGAAASVTGGQQAAAQ
ncbi:hypothetical protein [Nostoc sp. NZL]|uniref:hypothetical protein n=1 Tax=Nostoc sp. NZL TaxID=2650612 RepID=UPI0018C7E46F|nr:hypothetical protein [Nostoc sp. NZL]